jgi:hypothetical protein
MTYYFLQYWPFDLLLSLAPHITGRRQSVPTKQGVLQSFVEPRIFVFAMPSKIAQFF